MVTRQTSDSVGFIDSHLHFWRWRNHDPVLDIHEGTMIARDRLPLDVESQLPQSGIVGAIVVQTSDDLEETVWLLDLASKHEWVRGVVGWLPISQPDQVGMQLSQMCAAGLVGIRVSQSDLSVDGCDESFDLLAASGVTLDLLGGEQGLAAALRVASAHPELRIVIDHMGGPNASTSQRAWSRLMTDLARHHNVAVKLSLGYRELPPALDDPRAAALRAKAILAVFGEDRVLAGSNWPVSSLLIDLRSVWRFLRGLVETDERTWTKLARDNAMHWYKL